MGVLAMWALIIVATVLLLLLAIALAQTEKRIAALTGSQGYASTVASSKKYCDDIDLISKALVKISFQALAPVKIPSPATKLSVRRWMLQVHHLVGIAVLSSSMLIVPPACATGRFALLISNQSYSEKVGPLRNPHNDIALVGKALTEVGFKLLQQRKDATHDDMLFAVHELALKIRDAGRGAVSFLYYAGHGVAV